MKCFRCDEKMILKRLGSISLAVCYECPKCGFKDDYSLREVIKIPSLELFEKLENIPFSQLEENQIKWLKEFDVILDKYNTQSLHRKAKEK